MVKAILLTAVAIFLASTTVCMPNLFGENAFLQGFVTHEILALMAVILTVTLASVANIHLSLNRIVITKFSTRKEMVEAAQSVKKELSDNAWYIFWGFAAVIILLIAKGISKNLFLQSAVNAACIWVLLVYILCMYDIYRVVFGLTKLELELGVRNEAEFPVDVPNAHGGEEK